MNLTWTNRVIKHVLLAFNLVFVITGIIMIAVGVAVKSYYTEYDVFLSDSYFSLPNLLIAIGSLIFFISFFGCCGAIKESWFMIFIFSCLLSIIFIMEFSAGIAGYVLRDKTSSYLSDELKSTMGEYKFSPNNTPNAVTVMWDEIQYEFQCCGASGPEDWATKAKLRIRVVDSSGSTASIDNSTTPVLTSTANNNPVTTTKAPPTPTATTTSNGATNQTTNPTKTTSNSNPTTKDGEKTFALPGSCCKSRPGAMGNITCEFGNTATTTYYERGCVEGFGAYLKDHAVTIGGVGLAIAFIQLLGVIFACHLTKQLKNGFYST